MYNTINARMYIDRSTELPLFFPLPLFIQNSIHQMRLLTIRIVLLAQLIIDIL